jgi:5'-3' exonuclease
MDASIYIFQAWFSPHYEVLSKDGRDLSAFFGFAQFLNRFLRQTRPRSIAIAFDESLFCGFRHTLYPAYKANRELPDEELARQLHACAALAPLMGVAAWGSKVYEADDIIGTLASVGAGPAPVGAGLALVGAGPAREQNKREHPVCIVSRDKDLAQLLHSDADHLWDYTGNTRRYRKDIQRQYGIRPEQIPDYLGLVGDAVDSIPGVPGIGPVAATSLLQHFVSIPLLYENLQDVGSLRYRGASKGADLLRRHEAQARLSRTLATIVEDVDDPAEGFSQADITDLQWQRPDVEGVAALLEQMAVEELARERFLTLLQGLQPAAAGDPA